MFEVDSAKSTHLLPRFCLKRPKTASPEFLSPQLGTSGSTWKTRKMGQIRLPFRFMNNPQRGIRQLDTRISASQKNVQKKQKNR
jgi:hypothetical protein